ncbi:hypothetical protein ACH40E_01105 [Streptomyces acidicola]|uniref:hypothetical protein n=1 Tax=Streptomyces acidicola TaxID=2596892 RepID=UPI00379C5FBF
MIGWLIGEVRELIGRVFRTGECLRAAGRLLGQAFLHRSREPLAQAPIVHVTAAESAARQLQLAPEPMRKSWRTAWSTAALPEPADDELRPFLGHWSPYGP